MAFKDFHDPLHYMNLAFDISDTDDTAASSGYMAVRAAKLSETAATSSMDWTFPDGQEPPEGSSRKFLSGSLKNKTFLDVTMEHPEQYFATYKTNSVS